MDLQWEERIWRGGLGFCRKRGFKATEMAFMQKKILLYPFLAVAMMPSAVFCYSERLCSRFLVTLAKMSGYWLPLIFKIFKLFYLFIFLGQPRYREVVIHCSKQLLFFSSQVLLATENLALAAMSSLFCYSLLNFFLSSGFLLHSRYIEYESHCS